MLKKQWDTWYLENVLCDAERLPLLERESILEQFYSLIFKSFSFGIKDYNRYLKKIMEIITWHILKKQVLKYMKFWPKINFFIS